MKKTTIAIILALPFIFAACKNEESSSQGKKIGGLYLSKEKPVPGQNIDITYSPGDSASQKPEAYLYYSVKDNLYPKDINLSDSSGLWRATIHIPDSATAIAFDFKNNGLTDNNDRKGYVQELYNEDGKMVPGGLAGTAFYYQRYAPELNLGIKNDSILNLYKLDMEAHPEISKEWETRYANLLSRNNPEAAKDFISGQLENYKDKDKLSETDYQHMADLYSFIDMSDKSDSIEELIVKKFPKGKVAKSNLVGSFYKEKDLEKKKEMLADFKERFPQDESKLNFMYGQMARAYFEKGEPDKFQEYASKITDKENRASIYNSAAWKLAEDGENLELADQISKKSLDLIQSLQKDGQKPFYLSETQYKQRLENTYAMYADTYGLILFKEGKNGEAVEYQEKALGDKKSGDVNERYLQFLMADGQYSKLIKEAEEFIKKNAATAQSKEYYKGAYIKEKGSLQGYEEKLASLEKEGRKEAMKKLRSEMLDDEAPSFKLKDLEGKEVALEDLKGKTVVLDFWATWCGPCKASFPGMETAVNNFKDDDHVKFLFIDTMENGDVKNRKKNAQDFITQKGYPFHVLLDEAMGDGGRAEKTANKFGITGIPTKIIIGPDGRIKFKAIGYYGNPDALAEEVEMMIELTRA